MFLPSFPHQQPWRKNRNIYSQYRKGNYQLRCSKNYWIQKTNVEYGVLKGHLAWIVYINLLKYTTLPKLKKLHCANKLFIDSFSFMIPGTAVLSIECSDRAQIRCILSAFQIDFRCAERHCLSKQS